jgi:VanZ family protein
MAKLRASTKIARAALVVSGLACAIGMIGPFQGVEEAIIPWDKAAHFIAFYGLTALLYASFPDRRRFDLTLLAILAGAGTEVAQQLTGRDAGMDDLAADAVGAFAVLLPIWIERLRREPQPERRRRPSLPTASISALSVAAQRPPPSEPRSAA